MFSTFKLSNFQTCNYLPPPAQAQAHPPQAQAQAHPLPPLLRPLDLETGTGLVFFVTLLVKSFRLPTTFSEKPCTPVTIDAAKSEPGSWGMEDAKLLPGADDDGVPKGLDAAVAGLLYEGSYRPHHIGTKTGPR